MDKRIFKYFDGESEIFADPSELDFQIAHLDIEQIMFPERLADIPTLADGTIDHAKINPLDVKLMVDSSHDADPLIRQAFQVKPFDRTTGKGMLFEEVVELFNDYLTWRNDVKKNMQTPPTSATATG